MNIVRQDVDALNAVLRVEVAQADYQSKVKNSLEKYRKTAKIPGFRPGHVPMAIIEKQVGKAVLAEELNKMVNDELYQFIETNKIDVLGNPIPKHDAQVEGNFDRPENFVFEFEIGLKPSFQVDLSGKSKYDFMRVKIDDALLNKQIEDLRRRYGKLVSVDSVGDKDMLMAQFVELSEDGSIKAGGILHSSTISMEFVSDKAVQKLLIGKSIGDKVEVNPYDVSRGGKDTAAMLGVKEDQLTEISNKFQMTINEIKRMEMAELGQSLYDKLFGADAVSDEKGLKERITSDLKQMFENDSDRLLTKTIYEDLLKNTKLNLPDAFLKRWIKLSNEKEITAEQIEVEYDGYAKGLKWQLIQNEIFRVNNIELNNEELIDFTKGLLVNNYAQYGIPAPDDDELNASARKVLSNREEANRIYEMLVERKLTLFFKETVRLNEKEISYEKFIELASN